MASGAWSEDGFLAKLSVEDVDPPESRRQPRPSGPRTPAEPLIPGLADQVWDSYTTGSFKLIPCPSGMVDRVRSELMSARRYLQWEHRDDPDLDIRGLTKSEVTVIVPADVEEDDPLVEYLPKIRKGEVGVLFRARPPQMRGLRARRAKQEGEQTRQSRAEYKREWRARQKEQRSGATAKATKSSRTDMPKKVANPFAR